MKFLSDFLQAAVDREVIETMYDHYRGAYDGKESDGPDGTIIRRIAWAHELPDLPPVCLLTPAS